ncbi:glycosyltransferase, GT4 family [Polaribacter sp. Hel1_85]|nr:glycosyltransferase, GT4 family [Polaribacter sp. Hel1_85]
MIFQNKKIIFLLKSFTLGGAEKQALNFAAYLQNELNCSIFIYSYIKTNESKLFYEECEKLGLNNLRLEKNPLSASGNFKYIKRRIKIFLLGIKLRKHNPDIIIPYLNPPSIIAVLCYKISGAKITFWHHRGADYYRGDYIEKIAVKKTPFFLANSIEGKKELESKFKIKKGYFLPNFSTVNKINTNNFLLKNKGIKGKVVLGMIAHFREEKLQIILIEVFSKLLQKNKNIHLVLVGDALDKKKFNEVKKYIFINNLKDSITILHNTKAEDVLPCLDIGVLISLKEGMPNTVMEYMGYSLPIVVTKHDGCVSLLGSNYKYFIDNKNEVDQLNKLEKLILEEKERKKIGEQNYMSLQNNFTIEKYINRLTVILNS